MKTILVILGAGATGKSTLTRAICGPLGVETQDVIDDERLKYATFADTRCAIAGNIKNGSDSVSSMEVRSKLIEKLLRMDGVDTVVCDGVRCSRKWDVDWMIACRDADRVVWAYFDLPLEENVRRLQERRVANGKDGEISTKTLDNVASFRRRASGVWEYARRCDLPRVTTVRLDESHDAASAARYVRAALAGPPVPMEAVAESNPREGA